MSGAEREGSGHGAASGVPDSAEGGRETGEKARKQK